MRHANRNRWTLGVTAVGVLAFLLRWYFVATAMVVHPVRGDAVQYFSYAWNLLHHGVFSSASPGAATVLPDSFRDPGYPALLAAWFAIGGNSNAWYAGILMTQALLGALTVVLVMLIGRRWLTPGWAIAAGVVAALWPHSVAITGYLLTETLFGFLCALALWLFCAAWDKRSHGWMALAGIAFGAASLTNAVLTPFFLLLSLLLFFRTRDSRRLVAVLLVTAFLLPGLWNLRSLALPTPASAQNRALINLVQGSWPAYHDAYRAAVSGDPRGQAIMTAIQNDQDRMTQSPAAGLHALAARIAASPLRYASWYLLRKPVVLWGWNIRMGQGDIYVYPTVNSPFDKNAVWRVVAALCYGLNHLLAVAALIGALLLMRRAAPADEISHKNSSAGPVRLAVALMLFYVTAVYALFQSEPRYSIPFRGFEILAAITALAFLSKHLIALRAKASVKANP